MCILLVCMWISKYPTFYVFCHSLDPEASIDYLMLDDDLIQLEPTILNPELLKMRYSDEIVKKMGRIMDNLYKNHTGERVKRFFTV